MAEKKYQTIVIEYEGDDIPVKGFAEKVAGCDVVDIVLGHEPDHLQGKLDAIEAIVWADEIEDAYGALNSIKNLC